MAPEISASTSGFREMLQGMTWASPPALRMPSAAASQASSLRLEITTLAPSLASSSAEERPMPRLEPVTTATLPVRSNGVDCIVNSLLRHSGMRRLAQARNPYSLCWRMDAEHEYWGYGFRVRAKAR